MSGEGFSNPIIGGGGALVYPSIHSPNFVTGVSGWTIKKDGSAEFNNLTIRGTFFGLHFIINSDGFFLYSGIPAAGNLIASVTTANGADSFGNPYLTGFSSYSGAGIASEMVAGALRFAALTNPASLAPEIFTANANIAGAALNLSSGKGTNAATVATISLEDSLIGTGGTPQIVMGVLANLLVAQSSALLEVQGKTTALVALFNGAFAAQVAGDTVDRWSVDSNGDLAWGTGGAAQDTVLYRAGNNKLSSSPIAADLGGGVAESPHAINVSPGYVNGWADGGRMPGKFRLVPSPENEAEMAGSLTVPAGVAAGQNITGALPLIYRPSSTHSVAAVNVTNNLAVRMNYGTGGVLQFGGPLANVAAGNIIDWDVKIPLNF